VGQTVSSGIVSGLARSGAGTGSGLGYFLQTDAPINPGNSGGALIDINGDLIGINTRILSRSGGSNGIGFAIPANLVREFMNQARAGAEAFRRPWAGMAGQPVDADLAASLGMDLPEGMVISDLHPRSPFAKAGFKVGDVITQVDGQQVNSPPEMVFRMTVAGLGSKAAVSRLRDGAEEVIDIDMFPAPDDPPSNLTQLGEDTALPGLTLARINPAIIVELGLPLNAEGVVVADPGPFGARVGLQPGDIFIAVNQTETGEVADVERALTESGRRVSLDLLRRGKRLNLRFRL
jgi:S1-C subfamily serine protease